MDENASPGRAASDFFIARQPVFNAKLDVFGHELFFRKCSGDSCALIEDYDDATNQIIADGFAMAAQGLKRTEKVTLNVGYDNILSGYVLALPADRVILEVPAHLAGDAPFLGACEALAAKGYAFLIDNYGARGRNSPTRPCTGRSFSDIWPRTATARGTPPPRSICWGFCTT
jgi:EAL and modified HD-GYP domain-containing signal transduction protein